MSEDSRNSLEHKVDDQEMVTTTTALNPTSAEFVPSGMNFHIPQSNFSADQFEEQQRQLHPLHQQWAFWTLLPKSRRKAAQDKKKKMPKDHVKINEFSTVEDFWSLMNAIHPPSGMIALSFCLFKKDLDPRNDDTCREGGRWVIQFETIKGPILDEMWTTTMLAVIGEQIHDGGEHVAGAVVSIRQTRSKISLWVDRSSAAPLLGKQFHRLLRKVASDFNIALGDFYYEDFGMGQYTYIIRAMVAPVPEDSVPEEDDVGNFDDHSDFGGLGLPASDYEEPHITAESVSVQSDDLFCGLGAPADSEDSSVEEGPLILNAIRTNAAQVH